MFPENLTSLICNTVDAEENNGGFLVSCSWNFLMNKGICPFDFYLRYNNFGEEELTYFNSLIVKAHYIIIFVLCDGLGWLFVHDVQRFVQIAAEEWRNCKNSFNFFWVESTGENYKFYIMPFLYQGCLTSKHLASSWWSACISPLLPILLAVSSFWNDSRFWKIFTTNFYRSICLDCCHWVTGGTSSTRPS